MMNNQAASKLLRAYWPLWVILLITIPYLVLNLTLAPATWYDEGLNLNAIRTLAETGQYGLSSANGPRLVDPAIQTGPPVIIPLALLYHFFGVNLALNRLFIVACSIAALIAFYALATQLYGHLAAFLTIAALLLMPGESTASFVMLSRQVLGEIPAILCVLLGLNLLLMPGSHLTRNILIGLCFGLAIAIKSQVLVVLTGTIILFAIYEVSQRRGEWRRWLVIISAMLSVYAADTVWRSLMAGSQLASNAVVLREGAFIHLLPFHLKNLTETGVLIRVFGVAAVLFGTWVIKRRGGLLQADVHHARVERLVALFVIAWMAWFAIASIGWRRYSFIGIAFDMLFVGAVAAWVWQRLHIPAKRWAYIGLIAAFAGMMSVVHLNHVTNTTVGGHFFELVEYLQHNISDESNILSLEWSAGYFAPHHYIYPPTAAINSITAAVFLGKKFDPDVFQPLASCPQYIVVGSFNVPRTIASALAAADPQPIFAAGEYRVYAIPPTNLVHLVDGSCISKQPANVNNWPDFTLSLPETSNF
jgi:4-amino-4-deoxy-L-arabinose transferase-like glycosyltransferase